MPPIIIIIEPTPGLTTTQRVLTLVEQSLEGISAKNISESLNHSVSMVLRSLKLLMAKRQIHTKKSGKRDALNYYPGCRPQRHGRSGCLSLTIGLSPNWELR